jgi:molybdenum cofactor cytidylyltransferase
VSHRIDIAILAAGTSTRAGIANKLLSELDNKSLVAHVADSALASMANEVHVVLGYQSDRLTKTLGNRHLDLLYNTAYETGIASSIRCAIEALPSSVAGIIICLADMPWISTQHIDALINRFRGDAVCAFYFQTQRGHPILFPKTWFQNLMSLQGDTGANILLKNELSTITRIDSSDDAILKDVDRLDDLLRT